ncbi:MAG: hypothetical protein HC899_12025 [Leptolyngbyaceae cyanobacterium SM1_4_3]|nr:hypothetical protein [Leptolyngbyaceae cyanobacterium SM1_4_3]
MARLKRSSPVLDKALRRMAGMRSLHHKLKLANGLNLTEYDARIQALQTKLLNYNTMLSQLDEVAGQIALLEQDLSNYSEKMLLGVAAQYGKSSLEYMQAGGKPRKRSARATSTTEVAPEATTNVTLNGNGTSAIVN